MPRPLLRHGLVCAAFAASIVVSAQDKPYPIFTADRLSATMKTLGPNVAGLGIAVRDRDYSAAKARAIRSREQLAVTVTFWRDQDRRDAVEMLRAVLGQLDLLDGALSLAEVDAGRVERLLTSIQEGCAACHRVYRERDTETGAFRLNRTALR